MEFFRFVSAGCLGVLGGDQIYKHVENTPVFVSDEAAGDRGAERRLRIVKIVSNGRLTDQPRTVRSQLAKRDVAPERVRRCESR